MTVDEKIQTARAIVAETEAKDQQTWSIVRGLLGEIEEELRTLRRESERKQMEFFTRREFAKRVKVSESTIKRMIDDGELEPLRFRGLDRFSSLQIERIHELLSKKENSRSSRLRRAA